MDFHTLLYQAQKNNTRDKEVKYFKASLDPPKKETKESRQLSDSIKRFLAKKDEEDRLKQIEEQKKKDELILLRSQDRKSFKRVQSMLNRTKSANKSVIEDAKDDVNTSVTMAGFNQPDEDDYGYVSKDAMAIYNNIMNKYVNTPADTRNVKTANHRSHDISGTKDRVRAALLKEEEDQLLPHKRKRKPKDVENGEDYQESVEPQQKKSKSDSNTEKIKKRPAQPPPLNFQELLKIAEKKQFEPIIIEKPKKEEPLPMMTKKERQKYLEEKRIEEIRQARRQGKCLPITDKPKEIKPTERIQKSSASSSKVDLQAEDKLKKNASVWSKDLKISKELNNNSKNDKYVPRPLNNSESSRMNSNGNKTTSKSSLEQNMLNEKRYSSNDERYSPKPRSINDQYIPKTKNSIENNFSPKPRGITNNDRYVSQSRSSSSDKYSPKPKSSMASDKYVSKPTAADKYVPKSRSPPSEKYSQKPKSVMPSNKYISKSTPTERYMPKSRSPPSDKYSPKPKSLIPSDKNSSKPTLIERYVPKPKFSTDEKYSSKVKSTVQPERYVPKVKSSSSTEQYIPSAVKNSTEKYSPRPMSSQSVKSKPTSSNDRYVPMPVDKSKKLQTGNNIKPRQPPPKEMASKQFPPRDMKPKQFPPRDMVPKQFPPRDMVPKQFPPPDMRRRNDQHMPMRNKRQVIESDSDEYDSELDDFIDDGPEDDADYSKVISEIFKYDKSKYRGMDEDDECMESDYRTLQKEEYKSTRAGLLEDLADIRREKQMMKRRKKL
ncbi:protein SPT2 homolog [Rhopalosiphum maidis]|uniref:protein SPT2 homolog n=1 Tax=Rhopalosiphum maidis TaxID=43146 RepID=UPI000F00A513|nr:protein SPT2 homolog [Rhopalosiphum maidis]